MKRYPFIWKRRNINTWDISVLLATHFQLGFPDVSILLFLPLSGQLILSTPEVNKIWNLWIVAWKIHYKFLIRWFYFLFNFLQLLLTLSFLLPNNIICFFFVFYHVIESSYIDTQICFQTGPLTVLLKYEGYLFKPISLCYMHPTLQHRNLKFFAVPLKWNVLFNLYIHNLTLGE